MAQPHDQVITYIVYPNGVDDASYKKVEEALGKGYRVVDVITATPSNGTDTTGSVVITDAGNGRGLVPPKA